MKLNNKGFALTSIIYMLIVLFLLLLLLILSNLATRKVVIDKLKFDVKNKFDQGPVEASDKTLYDILIRYYHSNENPGRSGYQTYPGREIAQNDEGLIKNSDDIGDSYYFRGNVGNNYVLFGGQLYRIIRINGDGSVRMILEESIGMSNINDDDTIDKYNGYTYDKDTLEQNNKIKQYLEDWYNGTGMFSYLAKPLALYDEYIAQTTYCNDTTQLLIDYQGPNNIYYSSFTRLNPLEIILQPEIHKMAPNQTFKTNAEPSLSCGITPFYHGGSYNMKIGLVTADEVAFAGGTYYEENITSSHYLTSEDNLITMTPSKYLNLDSQEILRCYANSSTGKDFLEKCRFDYDVDNDGGIDAADASMSMKKPQSNYNFIVSNGFLKESSITEEGMIKPVISLKKDVIVINGNGTIISPYVIYTAN